MKPSFFKPNYASYQSSPAGGAGPSERTASPGAGRASPTEKPDKPKNRFFDTPLNPSRLASGFNKLFGKKNEAKEQLKQTAKEILKQVERHLGEEVSFDENTKKKLNSSLRKTMTADEMGMLADTLHAAEKHRHTNAEGNIALDLKDTMIFNLSSTTKKFASGHIGKNEFMGELKNVTQKLNDIEKEKTAARAVLSALKTLKQLDRKGRTNEIANDKYASILELKSQSERLAKFEEFADRLKLVNDRLQKEPRANCYADVAMFNVSGPQPEKVAARAAYAELKSLHALDKGKQAYSAAVHKYEAIKTIESPADRKAKFEEFAGVLKYVNNALKQNPHVNVHDFVESFNPFSSRESQRQAPPRSGPPPRRPQSGPSSQRPQSAQRPAPQAMPNQASTAHARPAYWKAPVAYAGDKISFTASGVRPDLAEVREHAAILKQQFNPDQLRELHSDLLALSNTATDDMKNAFNEKYKNVFKNKYDDNPAAFAVFGKVGLSGCGGEPKQSSFWSMPSAHGPRG